MACTDRCHDCGEPICENQCTCQVPDYSNIGECRGSAEITNCVNYSGNDDTCLAIAKPIGLTSVLQKIIAYIKNVFNRITSDSLVITTPGSCDDLKIEIVPSEDEGNIFTLGEDGKPFVPNTITPGDYDGAGNVCLSIEDGNEVNDVLDILIARVKDTVTVATSDSLSVTRGAACTNNTMAIELVPSEDDNNILILGTDGLPYVPETTSIAGTLVDADNGLHVNGGDTVYLGGTLLDDTIIGLGGNDLSITNDDISFGINSSQILSSVQDTDNDEVTVSLQNSYLISNLSANISDYSPSTGYLSLGIIQATADDATIGYKFPIVGGSTPALIPKTSSYLTASPYNLTGYANEILFNSPSATLTSGALVTGKNYRINVSSGGADFTPSGAVNNTVGTTFVANGVIPTWGTGTLELLGSVILANNSNSNLRVTRSSIISEVDTDTAAPTDFRALSIVQPAYCHMELSRDAIKNAAPLLGYLSDAAMLLQGNASATTRTARIGVSVPSLVATGTAPDPTQLTCMTTWANTSGDVTTNGLMYTYSPYVSFRGIVGFNGDDAKVGINVALPTNPLHVNNTADVYPLRLENPKTPSAASATGVIGEISWDTSYIYICVATNTWKRVAITTW